MRPLPPPPLIAWLLLAPVTLPAQSVPRPGPSVLWSGAPEVDLAGGRGSMGGAVSRTDGLAVGAVIGAVAAGIFGLHMCRRYGTQGDCWGTAAWWGVIGGAVGGLIGAGAGKESEGRAEEE